MRIFNRTGRTFFSISEIKKSFVYADFCNFFFLKDGRLKKCHKIL